MGDFQRAFEERAKKPLIMVRDNSLSTGGWELREMKSTTVLALSSWELLQDEHFLDDVLAEVKEPHPPSPSPPSGEGEQRG